MLRSEPLSLNRILMKNTGTKNSNTGNNDWSAILVPFATTISIYATIEIGFYIYYHAYLYPKGNQLTTPHPYPGKYAKNRIALLQRMVERTERTVRLSNRCIFEHITEHFRLMIARDVSWKNVFLEGGGNDNHSLRLTHLSSILSDNSTSTCESSDSISTGSCSEENNDSTLVDTSPVIDDTITAANTAGGRWVHPLVHKGDCDRALAFGFFAKDYDDLEEWELAQVNVMFNIFESRYGITFREGFTKGYYVRRTSLDELDTLHRPLSYYALVKLHKTLGNSVLRFFGFRRYTSKTTHLVCWHRPLSSSQINKDTNIPNLLPTLFFHGIAPAGLPLYIAMLLHGLLYEPDRPIFLFETPYIASTLGFENVITKEDTMLGIKDILNQFAYTRNIHQPLSIIGHSFGTFVATWCVYDEILRRRIKQLILLDPVSILLSEPDVMNKFDNPGFFFWLLGTSELHVNHYVRRQFHWYTSELWLEDIPENCYSIIGLAHEDTIVNAPKVKREVLTYTLHNKKYKQQTYIDKFQKQTKILYWNNAFHGYCCLFPKVWKQIKNVAIQQESLILKQQQQQQEHQHQQNMICNKFLSEIFKKQNKKHLPE